MPAEFDLLAHLVRNAGRIVSETLAREVWQEMRRATPLDNVIDVHVAHLRRKIDDGFAHRLVHTVRGVGFALRVEPNLARLENSFAELRRFTADRIVIPNEKLTSS